MKFAVGDGQKGGRSLEVDYNFGANLDEAQKLFSHEVVYNLYVAKAKVQIQDKIRPMMKAGKTDKEILAFISNYKLGTVLRTKKSPVDKALDMYDKMSSEERKALLAKLKGK
jgi:hypothetical protein